MPVKDQAVAQAIGRNVKRCREQTDLSQEQLSLACGLHRTEISMIERGHRIPRADTLLRVAQSLKVSTDELLKGIQWHPAKIPVGNYSINVDD